MNITKEQLVALITHLAESAEDWNDAVEEPGERGRGNDPLVLVIYEDGSGVVASSVYGKLALCMNVQREFANPEECAAYLIEYHDALEGRA